MRIMKMQMLPPESFAGKATDSRILIEELKKNKHSIIQLATDPETVEINEKIGDIAKELVLLSTEIDRISYVLESYAELMDYFANIHENVVYAPPDIMTGDFK